MFQSRMFPGEKRFRLGSPCTAGMEGAFSRGCGRGVGGAAGGGEDGGKNQGGEG